jgi:hypothetical protein
MFLDDKTNVYIHAELDSTIIRGTHRPQDLIPAFMDVIQDTAEYTAILFSTPPVCSDPTAEDWDERWVDEETLWFLNEELWDTLSLYAPEGYYFGAHEGDGSDFGYWKIND